MKGTVILLGFIGLLNGPLLAQATRPSNRVAYTKGLKKPWKITPSVPVPTSPERIAEKARKATTFRLANDTKNAEKAYAELVAEGNSSLDYVQYHLYYAQALAGNGKFRESQAVYTTYEKLLRAGKSKALMVQGAGPATVLMGEAANYAIEPLAINTRHPEFSPTLYRDGLVFVSMRGKYRSKLFRWNWGRFLDLYYIPEAAKLVGAMPRADEQKRIKVKPLRLGRDAYTSPTANDSKTVGSFAGRAPVFGYKGSTPTKIRQFTGTINSKYHDGPATFTKDGSRVIFTRNNYNKGFLGRSKDGVNKLKLYTAKQINGRWSEAKELPFNSNEFSTGHPTLANGPNGELDQRLFFASDRPGGFGGTDIYMSTWTNGQWGEPVNLGPLVNSKGHELFPFADEEGNLYLASDGHGGLGGLDNFYVQLSEDSQPVGNLINLGTPLNSTGDDFGVVTDGKRNWGYFSSNRTSGGADDDVFRFVRKRAVNPCRELTLAITDVDTKEPLVNTLVAVASPINGNQQLVTDVDGLIRICLTPESDTRFVVSRDGYTGTKIGFSTQDFADTQASRLDITLAKRVTHKASTVILRGHVLSQNSRKPITNAGVTLVNECNGTEQKTTTSTDGAYTFSVDPDCNYRLEATKVNMGSVGGSIPKNSTEAVDVDLLMFTKGDIIRIDNIYYGLNKTTLGLEAARELDKLVALMNKYPAMIIEIRSHTDSRATAQYNKLLSLNRAKAAAAYLKSKGIVDRRVLANGYGESLPLNKCADGIPCSEKDHQQNRRTEIKILTVE